MISIIMALRNCPVSHRNHTPEHQGPAVCKLCPYCRTQRGQSRQLALWFGNGTLIFHQSGAVLFIRPVFMEINEEELGLLCCSGVRNLECYQSRKSDTPHSLMSQTVISAARYESYCSPLNSHRCFQAWQGGSSRGLDYVAHSRDM